MERRRDSDDARGYDRDSVRGSNRERGDDRGGSRERDRSGRDRDADRGSRRGGTSGFEYRRRNADDMRERASQDSKFDRILKGTVKSWKPADGENRIRILPPTWEGAKHYGVDIYVHYGVGADRQTYLDLQKMKGESDPITEEYEKFQRECDPDNKDDQAYLRELRSTQRTVVYVIDRDNEKEGVQAWPMPSTIDRDLLKISEDKQSGEVLYIDDPEDGYDVSFNKRGTGINTKYEGLAIARRPSPLGKDAWLQFAVDNPLPDQLQFFDYDHIKRQFGGSSGASPSREREGDDRRRTTTEREGDKGRDSRRESPRDEPHGRGKDAVDELTWESVHDMTARELRDLVEAEDLDIDPKEAKDDEDLADWVCEVMKLEKRKAGGRRERGYDAEDRARDDYKAHERDTGRGARDAPPADDTEDRLAKMRKRLRD